MQVRRNNLKVYESRTGNRCFENTIRKTGRDGKSYDQGIDHGEVSSLTEEAHNHGGLVI